MNEDDRKILKELTNATVSQTNLLVEQQGERMDEVRKERLDRIKLTQSHDKSFSTFVIVQCIRGVVECGILATLIYVWIK